MIQKENIQNALCAGENSPAVMQSFTLQVTPAIGFLIQFFPSLIYRGYSKTKVSMKAYMQTCRLTGLQKNDKACESERKSSSQVIRGVSESAYVILKVIGFEGNFQSFFLSKEG
jgi:hypothetical protein